MKTRYLFLCLSLLSCLNLKAQLLLSSSKHSIAISYFGETMTKPGFSLAYNQVLKKWDKKRITKRGKEKANTFRLNWTSRYAHYFHKRNHSGNILASGADFQVLRSKGSFLQMGLFLGGNLKVFNEDVYRINANNAVEKINGANNLTFIYGMRTSVGKYIRYHERERPLAIFLGSNLFFSTPFGTNTLLHNALEVGVKYHL